MISSRRPIVGIDIGNDTSLVCIAREGKLTVLTNSSGKHKTATVVAFTDSGRQIGDEAVGGRSQNYARTFTYFKRLIGVLPDLAPKVLQQEEPFAYYPIQLEGNGLCLPVTVRDETHLIRPASLMTSMLRDLKQTAEREMDGQEVDECVLSCPPSWNHVQRKELLDAATSAGLSVLRLLHDTTAVALNFGFFRTFKEPTLTCFLDMGAANFTASLVKFSEDALTVNGTISAAIGGRDFDTLMISNLAKELKTRKPPIDLAENKKARLKVLREVTRLKETLSANQHASTVVENLANDQDVKLSFNREEFERLCEPMLAKMEVVLSQLLEQTKVTKADIKDVEVVGGGLRIPCVQARLAKFFGKELAKHCDSNESVVRGCTLQCAILSRSMNTKELKIQDCAPFPVRICWMQQDDTEKALVLFKKFGKCPFQADVAISNAKLDAQGKVVVELRYADEETQAEAGKAPLLRAIVVPRSAGEKFKLRVKLNDHGLPEFKMAYVKETTEVEKDGKTKKTSKNVQLQMEVEVLGGLSAQEWKNSQELEATMAAADLRRKQEEELRYKLESYVMDSRMAVEEGGDWHPYLDTQTADKFTQQLREADEWLQDEGQDAGLGALEQKLKKLQNIGDEAAMRKREAETRPTLLRQLQETLAEYRTLLDSQRAEGSKGEHKRKKKSSSSRKHKKKHKKVKKSSEDGSAEAADGEAEEQDGADDAEHEAEGAEGAEEAAAENEDEDAASPEQNGKPKGKKRSKKGKSKSPKKKSDSGESKAGGSKAPPTTVLSTEELGKADAEVALVDKLLATKLPQQEALSPSQNPVLTCEEIEASLKQLKHVCGAWIARVKASGAGKEAPNGQNKSTEQEEPVEVLQIED